MEGILSTLKLTIGDPSVDAIAIPPLFAVVSVETSLPAELVVNPRTISASFTLNVSVNNVAEVPPTVIFPDTFKLLLTCKSLPIVTFPLIVGLGWIVAAKDVFDDEHAKFREMILEYEHPNLGNVKQVLSPVNVGKHNKVEIDRAPLYNEHTEQILREELDYSEQEIQKLKDNGIIS